MNIHDRSSLLLVPSGYKDGKLYSQVPSSGGGDFTFSRGSNLAATRVGADGLIEKGRENLLTRSNNFTAWNLQNVTSGHAGYDGTNDAWLQSGTSRLQRNISLGTSVYTGSIYVKAGFSEYVQLYIVGSSTALARFQLTGNGTIVFSGGISPKIEPVSGATGWYRISTNLNSDITTFRIYPQNDSSGTQTADSSVYIQDAQLEIGLAATDYIESGATTAKAGILENQPRFDYSGGASRASLLLEPQRTNDISNSEYVGSGNNSTISYNDTISPEGVENAIKVTITGTSQAGAQTPQSNVSLSTTYTQSCYVKKDVGDYFGFGYFQLDMPIESNNYIRWNLSDITLAPDIQGSYTNGKAEDVGNGWIRLSATITTSANSARSGWKFLGMKSNSFNSSNVGDSFYLYGLQAEPDAAYPTSYIPTYGTSVTRPEDTTSELALSPSYGSSNTWFFELKRITDTSLLNQAISIIKNDSTGASNRVTIYSTSNGRLRMLLSDENGTPENLYSPDNSFEQGETIKAALKITPSGCTLFVDGPSVATSSSVGAITGINAITYFKNAALNQFLVFPTALSDIDCELLTGTTYESFAAMAEALNYTVYE